MVNDFKIVKTNNAGNIDKKILCICIKCLLKKKTELAIIKE